MRLGRTYAWLVMGPAALLLASVFFAPLVYFFRYAFSDAGSRESATGLTFSNFIAVLSDDHEVGIILQSILIAVIATFACLVIGFPVALLMRAAQPRLKAFLIVMCIFPLLTGSVVRTIGWQAIFGYSGALNSVLLGLGLIDEPLELFRNASMVTVVIVSIVLSFMVLLLHSSLEQVDPNTERAATMLGAGPFRTFWQVTLPQVIPGVVAGTSLIFVVSVNAYATPVLIGAGQVPMIAPRIYQIVGVQGDFAIGAAFSAIAVVLFVAIIAVYGMLMRRQFQSWKGGETS